jgi:hypothetical protein
MTSATAYKGRIYDFLAPPLILVTAFISFVNHNDYSYAAPELWLCLAGLVALGLLYGAVMTLGGTWLRVLGTAALVTLFVDLQFEVLDGHWVVGIPGLGIAVLLLCWLLREHLSRIAAAAFATMLAATLAFPAVPAEAFFDTPDLNEDDRREPEPAPPVVVHLIFDAFIGLEGIPSDIAPGPAVRNRLRSFFQASGFHVFGRAYSRYLATKNAIPNALNYASTPKDRYFLIGSELRENRYFEEMYEQGYRIHVYQTDALDFCARFEIQFVSCRTWINSGIKPLETMKMPPLRKAELILQIFARTSVIERIFRRAYDLLKQQALDHGYHLPPWVIGRHVLGPERALHALGSIADEVAETQSGEMFFAHVMLPHRPYVLDRNCNLRDDPEAWDVNALDDELAANRVEARKRHYALYFEQVLCVESQLDEMFAAWRRAGVYDRMKIIIHGDHGSRIALDDSTESNKVRLLTPDYVDSFSTFFAVKSPGQKATYDARMVAIQDLLRSVAHELPLDQLPAPETPPYVLLENRDGIAREFRGEDMVRQPMPEFGDPEPAPRRIHLSQP